MIQYNNESQFFILWQLTGSILPGCLPVGLSTGFLGASLAVLRKYDSTQHVLNDTDYIKNPEMLKVLALVIGFLLVMRANMALNRWMHAVSQVEIMLAKWSDAYNVLNSFFSGKEGTRETLERILLFRIRVAHWFSLMSCLAFATFRLGHVKDLRQVLIAPRYPLRSPRRTFAETQASKKDFALGDRVQCCDSGGEWSIGKVTSVDPLEVEGVLGRSWDQVEKLEVECDSPWCVLHAPTDEEVKILEQCGDKVNLVALWITQGIMLEVRAKTLDAPPPIITRVFQEISIGMLGFHQAHKVAMVPFPFPFAQMVTYLLAVFFLVVPFYIDCFTKHVIITPIISVIVPVCYCGLNMIAVDLETPFYDTKNAVDLDHFNEAFLGLLEDTLLTPQVPPSSDYARVERQIIQGIDTSGPLEDCVPAEGSAQEPIASDARTPDDLLDAAPMPIIAADKIIKSEQFSAGPSIFGTSADGRRWIVTRSGESVDVARDSLNAASIWSHRHPG
jgi:predicted membrane chloride channel (bestrophin family)